jgi:polyvinyl alcohol dehydrogenase (cytochrome)
MAPDLPPQKLALARDLLVLSACWRLPPARAGIIAIPAIDGVVYAGSQDPAGHMYGLNAATGTLRWSFASGGSVNSGAAVANGRAYWGSGYAHIQGTPNNKVYAFGLP